MRLAACIAAALLAATPGTLARAASPRECAAIPRPTAGDLRPWTRSGPYAAGLKDFSAGRDAKAAAALRAAWTKVRGDLAGAFATGTCNERGIQASLARRLFSSPPQAVPSEDRFLPPRPVVLALAGALCAGGDAAGAAAWLLENTAADDAPARAAAAILWVSVGRVATARAMIPPRAQGPAWDAARKAIETAGEAGAADGSEGGPGAGGETR